MHKVSKVWFRFSKSINGKNVKFRWEQLPNHRFEDFLDFKMKYYVKHEVTHTVAGIHKNPVAMEEYRQIAAKLFKKPSYHTAICCVDDESNKMVGFNSLVLYKRGAIHTDVMHVKSPELQHFYKILYTWNNLCPVPDILSRYGVEQYFDDAGLAIHPEYRGYGFTTEVELLRIKVCKAINVPLTGAWMTSSATQNTTKYRGWDTIYEISSKRLEEILGVKFENTATTYMFNVKRIL